jgi:hypothetical protein
MTSDDRWTDPTTFDEELDRLLSGAPPAPEAPAWCSDVAVLVRTAQAPALEDELAGEADIVARMRALLTPPAGRDGSGGDDEAPIGTGGDDESGRPDEARRAGAYVAAASPEGDVDLRVRDEPVAERLRTRMEVTELDEYRAKHGERYYIAKHAAARLEASRYPVARTVGRVVAMKAVAVTTAAVISVAAAAAATTGIVATVVVPAFEDDRRPVAPSGSPSADTDDDSGTSSGQSRSGSGRGGAGDTSATCSNILMTCPPGLVVPTPADPGATTPAPGSATATSVPATTSTTDSTTTTTTTTAPQTPSSTEPDPVPTTTPTTEPDPTVLDAG